MTAAETITRSESETEAFGAALAPRLSAGSVVLLSGDLGAGKTALVRGIARGLGADAREVASPTFALLHEYADAGGRIVLRHLDLYRLRDDPKELSIFNLPESVADAPVCVEWPRAGIEAVLPAAVAVVLETLADGSRRIRVTEPDPG